jgi:hypothetical protein
MPPKRKTPDVAARVRVLDAYLLGEDWQTVARHNGLSATTAWRITQHGRVEPLPRGGARAKCTAETMQALEDYLEEDCTYTLQECVILFCWISMSAFPRQRQAVISVGRCTR